MYFHMMGQRKRASQARSPRPAAQASEGIEFPMDKESGERSSTAINKGAWAAAVKNVAPEKAKAIEAEKNWRFKYNRYALDHAKVCAKSDTKKCVQIAKDGLEYLHNNMEFIRGGKVMKLSDVIQLFVFC
jgi:hypothetical protein